MTYRAIEEIERDYNGNFVCLTNCKWTKGNGLLGGEIIAHGKYKDDIIAAWQGDSGSVWQWIGDFPEPEGGFLL